MRGVETRIQEIRHRIFREVARMAYHTEWPVDKRIEELPYKIIPGEVGNFRNDVFLERAIVGERLRLAMGLPSRSAAEHAPLSDNIEAADKAETYYTPPLINVIKFACNACAEKRVMVTDGCQGCLAHPCVEVCPKDAVSLDRTNGKSRIDPEKCIKCGQCAKVCSYNAIIIQERPCAAACGMDAIHSDENGKADIDYDKCVSCGMCLVNCPFGAIADKSQIFQVIRAIPDRRAGIRRCGSCLCGTVRPQGDARKAAGGHEAAGLCRCIRGCHRGRSLRGPGGRGLYKRGAGAYPLYGNLLLPGLVCDGKEAVPGIRRLRFHGLNAHDPDCQTH